MTLGLTLLAFAYLITLFWLGRWGDKHSANARKFTSHPAVYGLALAIYCTAWTFLGAVGEATRNQWNYLPILLGPALVYIFGRRFLSKLVKVSKKQNITTIADFISSRYGKRQTVALLVTLIALLATIPYIALQLKAIGITFTIISGTEQADYIILFSTFFIGLFCIYFGTQRTDVTEYRHGLMLAIAFESIVKLLALFLVAVVSYLFWAGTPDAHATGSAYSVISPAFFNSFSFNSIEFWAQTLIAGAAIICLPRQFHVAIVDNLNPKHLKTAQWLFPTYLFIIALTIPIIASFGVIVFGGQDVSPDTYVLRLALESDSIIVTGIVFLGGFSAATAMIIVATLTLSTMVTNDVILPRILTASSTSSRPGIHTQKILWIRRVVIAGLLILASLYHRQISSTTTLTHIGLLAFSLVVQLLPAIVGGLYWKRANAQGVYAGWVAGLAVWIWWLIVPLLNDNLLPQQQSEMISVAAVVSLFSNIGAFIVFSLLAPQRLADKIQAYAFVDSDEQKLNPLKLTASNVTNDDLLTVMNTFLGIERCGQLVQDFEQKNQIRIEGHVSPQSNFIQFCERALGGVIGASSAHLLINSVVSGEQLNFEQVIQVFDETARAIQINQSALFASLESMEQGISVIDRDLNLVAWNQRYLEMFDYPQGLVSYGTPIEELVRYNAIRGECGVGEVEMLVQKRVEHLRAAQPHKFIRQRSDGRVIEMVGNPLPSGGFVTSFNDITEHIELQKALEEANIDLEKRIQHRSKEVQAINAELRSEIERRSTVEKQLLAARSAAEEANNSKTRFLALASHDVLQPLNAAKLYLSALKEMNLSSEASGIFEKIDDSVNASETMISMLLDISRLEQGEMQPTMTSVSLRALLMPLIDEFEVVALKKGLLLSAVIDDLWVVTDTTYLHRIIRNLLSNAIKYTNIGSVTLKTRLDNQDANKVVIEVIDTGVGIPEVEQKKIFNDFYRVQNSQAEGVGLGLGVVSRLSKQIQAEIHVHSELWQGSCFTVSLERAKAQQEKSVGTEPSSSGLNSLQVLCIDDEQQNLNAMKTLLSKWGMKVECVTNKSHALQAVDRQQPNVLLVDYQLANDENGIDIILTIRQQCEYNIPAILVTANRQEEVVQRAADNNIHYLTKPLKPAKLRSLLRGIKPTKKDE
ncbi:PAS domain-containing hybrid sensor histidine kinase/response regulator [Alteromonas sp. a30]|uniref:PAS domain-containing hybrid sensor histidine kinase/response regulator n=1 Tax=Alteromonas sp. a30 TaxID=2730917 RepID=UPI00228079E8|nr:PAS-domain containing protein [Alteromonas sp. a30]MCY7295903.1 response regulator [Alteromonas sp. a30]